MEMFKINFISSHSLCADDFKNKPESVFLNLKYLVSISDLLKFYLPTSGGYVNQYSIVTMLNNSRYYITEEEYLRVYNSLILEGLGTDIQKSEDLFENLSNNFNPNKNDN